MKECFLSVIIPAYNEGKRLLSTLSKICAYLSTKDFPYEIIVVDDGSTDNTLQMVKNFASSNRHIVILINEQNSGKGYAKSLGMLPTGSHWSVNTVAHIPSPVEEIEKCL